MKVRHFLCKVMFVVLTLCLCVPTLSFAAEGITPAQIDTMAVDPQSFTHQRDMDWSFMKKNPVINWSTEVNPDGLEVEGSLMNFTGRKIKGAVILFDYLDRKFISGQPKGTDLLGFPVFTKELAGEEGKKHGEYANDGAPVKNPLDTVLDYVNGEYPNGYQDLPKYWADYLSVENDWADGGSQGKPDNHGITVDTYWLENSYGKWGATLDGYGVYTVPYFEFELISSQQTWRDVPPSFRYNNPGQARSSTASFPTGTGATRTVTDDIHAIELSKRGSVMHLISSDNGVNPWGIPNVTATYQGSDSVLVGNAADPASISAVSSPNAQPINFAEYDFTFLLHAGYDESTVWQEFGMQQYPSRWDIPWNLGPGNRLIKVELFFNAYPEFIPVYAERYKDGWANYKGVWSADQYDANNAEAVARVQAYTDEAFWEDTLDKWTSVFGSTDIYVSVNNNAAVHAAYMVSRDIWAGEKAMDGTSPGTGVGMFKLSQEDIDWANYYHGKDTDEGNSLHAGFAPGVSTNDGMLDNVGLPQYKNTRYVEFTAWEAAVSEWSHSGTTPAINTGNNLNRYGPTYGASERADGLPTPRSDQGESDGTGTFSHEFGHIASVRDNYSNPWERPANPATDFWDLMGKSNFNGPGGEHARWGVLPIEASSIPGLATHNLRNIWHYYDEGEKVIVSVEELSKGTPVVANIVPRNVPINNQYYPNLGVPKLNPFSGGGEGFVKAMQLDFGTGDFADKNELGIGYTNFHSLHGMNNTPSATPQPALRMSVEVVQQAGADSYNFDSGVFIEREYNITNAGQTMVDSHNYDIAMTDYLYKKAEGGDKLTGIYPDDPSNPNIYVVGHPVQLMDGLFHAGKSYTDTGYYGTVRDANDNITKYGSVFRWEPRDDRPIVAGDTVNEWRDEVNKLHFYILDKKENAAKYGDFISYQVAIRHDDGAAVGGALNLSVKDGGEAAPVTVGNYTKQTYVLTNTNATATDIVRVGLTGSLAQGRTRDITVDMTARNDTTIGDDYVLKSATRTVPTFYSEQNTVILNDLYSIAPGKSVEFDVYIKQVDANTITNLAQLLTVTVSSETNPANSVSLSGTGALPVTTRAISGLPQPVAGAVPVTSVTSEQFTGSVAWSPAVTTTFAHGTAYTATVTLTAAAGYTFNGVPANSFTVAGATATNAVNSGTVSAVFPATAPAPIAPVITTSTLPEGTVGTSYSATLAADGDAPIDWSLSGGSLPGGVNLYSTGSVTGTPTSSGTFNFTVKASNAAGSATKELSIVVNTSGGVIDPPVPPVTPSDPGEVAARMPDINESDLVETPDGKVAVSEPVARAAAENIAREGYSVESVNSLPVFEATVTEAGATASVRITVTGAQLGVDSPQSIRLMKMLSSSAGEYLRYVSASTDYADGRFTLCAVGGATPVTGEIVSSNEYDLLVFIKDGGKYDLDKTENGTVIDPLALVKETEGTGGGSGGGCNAGYALLAFAALVPFVIRKRK